MMALPPNLPPNPSAYAGGAQPDRLCVRNAVVNVRVPAIMLLCRAFPTRGVQLVLQRPAGIQNILMGVHRSGAPMSAASKGAERQAFIERFLANVLPPTFRFGSGDATDAVGHHSGQLDVVVEYPFAPSLPSFGGGLDYISQSRLRLSSIKSDAAAQWGEAQRTADQLAPLQRTFNAALTFGAPSERIPLFVAGYTGWKTIEAVKQNLQQCPNIAGVLVIESGIFVSVGQDYSVDATGPWSLWGLISCLNLITNTIQAAAPNPLTYAE
jgi:hypothetical protein